MRQAYGDVPLLPAACHIKVRAMYSQPKAKLHFLWFVGILSVGWLNVPASGQDGPQIDIVPRAGLTLRPRSSSLRAEVNMVIIPALITDQFDRPVLDLRKDEFHLFEGDQEQKIQSLAIDEAPASIGIVFDSSGSMVDKIDNSREAVRRLLRVACQKMNSFWCNSATCRTYWHDSHPRQTRSLGSWSHFALKVGPRCSTLSI
jgi:hypothetical protein